MTPRITWHFITSTISQRTAISRGVARVGAGGACGCVFGGADGVGGWGVWWRALIEVGGRNFVMVVVA